MKKLVTALLALCLCLLAACVGLENAAPAGQAPESPSDEEKPDYRLETIEAQRSFAASDGTELASYAYALPTLSVANLERLPPEEAEPAQRAVDTFNEKMRGMLNTSVAWGEDVADSAAGVYGDGYLTGSYYDESSYSANICGEIVSVRVDTCSTWRRDSLSTPPSWRTSRRSSGPGRRSCCWRRRRPWRAGGATGPTTRRLSPGGTRGRCSLTGRGWRSSTPTTSWGPMPSARWTFV